MADVNDGAVFPNETARALAEGDVAVALVRHVAAIFSEDVDATSIDLSASILSDEPFVVGQRTLDSLDLVHVFTAVEDELGSEIFDVESMEDIASLDKISRHLLARADPSQLQAYCRRWQSSVASP